MTAAEIQTLIEAGLPGARAEVRGAGGKFEAVVTCADFAGLSPVQRHRLVYAAVRAQLADGSLHALEIRPRTPDEAAADAAD